MNCENYGKLRSEAYLALSQISTTERFCENS